MVKPKTRFEWKPIILWALLSGTTLLGGCIGMGQIPEGLSRPVKWEKLPGWLQDRHAEAWPALLNSCRKMVQRNPVWAELCLEARLMADIDDDSARAFFETRFKAHQVKPQPDDGDGLVTGYYEPLLKGSRTRSNSFLYPVYRRPKDLLIIDLGDLYEDLKDRRLRGRLASENRVVPYFSRAEIDNSKNPLKGNEIAWVADPVGLFFLHIQGSGRIRLRDGSELAVGYRDQNGHPYVAIGRYLIERGEIEVDKLSMQTIREWLRQHPEVAVELLNKNPSYVFFNEREAGDAGPIGSLGVPLIAERSIAVDRRFIKLGLPVWLDTTLPGEDSKATYRRLVFAQDTGGAIRGAVRADLFWGRGDRAETFAGQMRQPGALYVLLPIERSS